MSCEGVPCVCYINVLIPCAKNQLPLAGVFIYYISSLYVLSYLSDRTTAQTTISYVVSSELDY